jgi:hypothetical protein
MKAMTHRETLGALCGLAWFVLPFIWLARLSIGWCLALAVELSVLICRTRGPASATSPCLRACIGASVSSWLLAASLTVIACIGRGARGALSADHVTDLLFSAALTAALSSHLWLLRGSSGASVQTWSGADRCPAGCRTCSWAWLRPLGILLSLCVSFGAVVELRYVAKTAPPQLVHTARGRLAYWCEGTPRNGSIAVLMNSYFGASASLQLIQDQLAATTRTCVFDPSGTGFSQRQSRVGFAADAADMKSVLDAEFERSGIDASGVPRVAIVGGHSRGGVCATTFKANYEADYSSVLVLSLDGSSCGGRDYDLIEWYVRMPAAVVLDVVAPLIPMLSGAAQLTAHLTPMLYRYVLTAGEPLPFDNELPDGMLDAVVDRYFSAGLWRRAVLTNAAWQHEAYDGAARWRCEAIEQGDNYIAVLQHQVCLPTQAPSAAGSSVPAPGPAISGAISGCAAWVAAGECDTWPELMEEYCADSCPDEARTCAGHVTMVTLAPFARVASCRIRCFLESRLPSGAPAASVGCGVYGAMRTARIDSPPSPPPVPQLMDPAGDGATGLILASGGATAVAVVCSLPGLYILLLHARRRLQHARCDASGLGGRAGTSTSAATVISSSGSSAF